MSESAPSLAQETLEYSCSEDCLPWDAVVEPAARARSLPVGDELVGTVPRWHFAMLNDAERNDAFAVALERRLWPGCHVLDIGSGSGLLAMMAIRAGAGRVTTCEANPGLAGLARQVVAAHGMGDVIDVLALHSTEMRVGRELAAPADLIVSEIVDCGLIGEHLLSTVRHARGELLAPGGQLLPQRARLLGCLLESQAIERLNRVHWAGGFDVHAFNRLSTVGHFPVRLSTWPHRLLSQPVELARFDLAGDSLVDGSRQLRIPATTRGVAHGLVAWFELDLGAGVIVRNSPDNVASHWMQANVAFDRPVVVRPFEEIPITFTWQENRLYAAPSALIDMEVK